MLKYQNVDFVSIDICIPRGLKKLTDTTIYYITTFDLLIKG